MGNSSETQEQILSLPKGGGAIQGLGETFQPDLHTGTGSFSIPLDIPNGPNDIAPKLSLFYQTGAGQGPFGMGFSLNLLTIQRSMNKRIPTYLDDDPLILMGGGELVDVGGRKFRLKEDTNGWEIEKEGEGYRITDNEGKYHRLGVSENARLFFDTEGIRNTLSWHLEEIEDSLGYKVNFSYFREGNNLYLQRVEYGIYTVQFNYEERTDPIVSGRSGFLIKTGLRCKSIEMLINSFTHPLIRCWELCYTERNGHSLLTQVKMTGYDKDGASSSMPVLKMDYTQFHPSELKKFDAEVPDAFPGPIQSGRYELIDWDGDGIPDLIEIGSGNDQVWINKGNCIWSNPQSIGSLPTPIALDQPGIAFADMDGNGTADLIMLDRPLAGYYPHTPKGGFDQPVSWSEVPSVSLSDSNARLVDLNGDGITDLLFTGESSFDLYYRLPEGGWSETPQSISRSSGNNVPPVSLSDPHIHLADMNGDGLQDLVRIDEAGVVYWPYLGNGMWDNPITLSNPLDFPNQYDPKRMFLSDIDGDGCADLVYIDLQQIMYWLNGSGGSRTMFIDPQVLPYTPPSSLDQIRFADMRGAGTAGILWSNMGATDQKTDYFYLDFTGGVKPYLLNRIDNGIGLVTEIEYGTSTAESSRDKDNQSEWKTFLPFPIPIITAVHKLDQVTSTSSLSKYRYHQGHYDGIDREFAGFGMTEIEEAGDESISPMLTRNWFHIGLDMDNLSKPLSNIERARLKALRGKLLKTEVYGLDGSQEQNNPYMRTESIWQVDVLKVVNNVEVVAPRQLESQIAYLERQAAPYRLTINRNLAFDEYGNVTEQEQRAEDPRDPSLNVLLQTFTTFAVDATGRFRNKPSKLVQRDGNGKTIAATVSYYDDRPEGTIGIYGLLTRVETLVLTDEIVTQLYGENIPDFKKLGYHRRDGEGGWWINQVSYTRAETNSELLGTVTNAKGNTTTVFFDVNKIQPSKIVDALGNSMEAQIDYRANKLQSLTDTNGSVIYNKYDPLGRLIYNVEPGATNELPTTKYTYLMDQTPVCVVTEQRTVNGSSEVLRSKVYLDGYGQVLEERNVVGSCEIVEQSQLYSVRQLVKTQFLPFTAGSPGYNVPSPSLPNREFRYDSIGRLIEVINSDGSIQKQRFEPGVALLYDEEDTVVNGPHADTPTRHTYGPTGRIMEVAINQAGRWISTHFEYDIKGNLLAALNANNQRTEFVYDLLGRRLRTKNPISGTSLFLFDAMGNQVERKNAENEIVRFDFDELDRLCCVSIPTTGEVTAEYIYHDTNRPAPPEASSFSKGKVVKVIHQGGFEIFDYDQLGRVTHNEIHLSGLAAQKLDFDYTYRVRGEIDTITYPKLAPNTGRLLIKYEYNDRGLLKSIPNYIRQIDYNVFGRRTRVEYANDVVTQYSYNTHHFRLEELQTSTLSDQILQKFKYQYDQVGNLLSVDSPDSKTSANYVYDDLYRLQGVSTASGNHWSYQYDDMDNITFKSDVGSYTYDSNGLLSAAGAELFTYTSSGQTANASWGQSHYDAIGRIASVTRGSEQMICTYNHEGHRVRMQVSGGTTPQDIFTPNEMISIENGKIFAYIMDGSIRVARMALEPGGISYLHGDHLGSTTLVTGPAGQVLQRIYYDPFGSILENIISNGEEGTHFLYTGHTWDEWSNLHYMGSRYYNPKLGRFITPDTIIPNLYHPQAWNRYSYVQNNPLRFIDPTGHFWEEIGEFFEKNWKSIASAAAIVAIGVLTVATCGVAGIIAVGVGMAIGGAVGGISAGAAGGDVLSGILVGMAVGGAAAYAGAEMSALFGTKTFLATLLTGTLAGGVNGAAMGFAAGFAGGQGSSGEIWKKMWLGALVGAVSGALFSIASYAFQQGWILNKNPKLPNDIAESMGHAAVDDLQKQSLSGHIDWTKSLLAGVNKGLEEIAPEAATYGAQAILNMSIVLGSTISADAISSFVILDYTDDLKKFFNQNIKKVGPIKSEPIRW